MTDGILTLDAGALSAAVRSGEVTAVEAVEAYLAQVAVQEPEVDAFLSLDADAAIAAAEAVDRARASGAALGPLAGVPVAFKDNLCTTAFPTTAASKILEGWVPPYNATVVERVLAAGAIAIGKTNLDEFAMGSSTENSGYKITRNPHDLDRVPGGSSGGSAAVIASRMALLALGSDTGGSIRQPASLSGIVGLKPTYGRVSRYGLLAYASSLDQIGPMAATVKDAALMAEVIFGHDPMDATSLRAPIPALVNALMEGVTSFRVGLVSDLLEVASPAVASAVGRAAATLAQLGAKVETISIPELALGLPAYYVVAPAEASSNLARYDGVRYGFRGNGETAEEMMVASRSEGFGDEVKRRIMLGTYALSAGYYDAFYLRAQRVRSLVRTAFQEAYSRFDLLLSPTSPTTAFKIGERSEDPVEMYRSDVCTIPSNLSGDPAISVPFGDEDGLPIGVQLMGPALSEERLLRAAFALESARAEGER